jgi:quercetin dioxygenase-like cupin family protein
MKRLFIGLCLVLFLSSSVMAADNECQVDVLTKTTTSWNDDILPHYPEGQPEITILKIIIPPKAKLTVHYHPVINAGVLLKGELTVTTENDLVLHLKAGEPIVEVVNTLHFGENQGTEDAELIIFYAGTTDLPITVVEQK